MNILLVGMAADITCLWALIPLALAPTPTPADVNCEAINLAKWDT